MKYLKKYNEGIFSKKVTNIPTNVVKWSYMETVKLEDIGCYRKIGSINVPFYFESDFSDKIKYIKIEKLMEGYINYTSDVDLYFYRVEIILFC